MGLFDVHHPLMLVFGILGNIVSAGVYFAPMPTFIKICKRKSTMGFQSLPYVVALCSSLIWLYYALIKEGNTFLLITINAFGSLIESIYVIIFIVYATPSGKRQTIKILSMMMVCCLAISLGSSHFLHGPTRALVVGWICVGISVCVFAAPLTILVKVVKTKSVEFMPFLLSFFLTLSAMMWFAYGMLAKDTCVTVPNVLGFILGLIQMGVYVYYKRMNIVPSITEIKLPEHIMNMKISSNSGVFPVDSSRSSGSEIEVEAEKEKQTTEGGGGEVAEQNKGGMVAVVDINEPCGVEVVNMNPILIVCEV